MKAVTTVVILMFAWSSFGQSAPAAFGGPVAYFELAGAGGVYSVNIENPLFRIGRWRGNFRLGYGQIQYRDPGNTFRAVPVGIHMLKYSGNHHAEVGVALSYIGGYHYVESIVLNDTRQSRGIFFVPMAGYRFQKPNGGLFFRVQYAPLIKIREFGPKQFFHMYMGRPINAPGIAIGYAFGQPLFQRKK